jgi:hypothetical protein
MRGWDLRVEGKDERIAEVQRSRRERGEKKDEGNNERGETSEI